MAHFLKKDRGFKRPIAIPTWFCLTPLVCPFTIVSMECCHVCATYFFGVGYKQLTAWADTVIAF